MKRNKIFIILIIIAIIFSFCGCSVKKMEAPTKLSQIPNFKESSFIAKQEFVKVQILEDWSNLEQDSEIDFVEVFSGPLDDGTIDWCSDYRVYTCNDTVTMVAGEEIDRDFLAKMLYAEGGAMTWIGKVYTCSAILNFCEKAGKSLWVCGHNENNFSVAPFVDSVIPTEECYEVVDFVMSGGLVKEICYFRTGRYHSFGTPVCEVDGHYFSKE